MNVRHLCGVIHRLHWLVLAALLLLVAPERPQAAAGTRVSGPGQTVAESCSASGENPLTLLGGLLGGGLVGFMVAWKNRPCTAASAQLELYRNLVEHSADPVYMLDMGDGFRMVFANDACCAHYGLTRPALYQLRLPEWDTNFIANDLDALRQQLRESRFYTLETEHRLSDGRIVPVEVSGNYLVHEGRELVAGYFRDISGRKRIETALRESKARFRAMADAAPVLIWVADTDTRCVWFNQVWLSFTGRSLEEEYGDGWLEGVHPDDLADCVRVYTTHFDARQPFRMEYRLRRHDGEYRWILDAGQPRFEADGTFHGYIGSCIDITDHKLMENALRISEQLLEERNRELDAIFNLSPDGFVAFDGARRVKYASPAFMAMFGLDHERDPLIGREAEDFCQWLGARCESNAGESLTAWLRHQFGMDIAAPVPEVLLLEFGLPSRGFEARARRNQTEAVSVILYFHDITERLEVERMKSDFLSTAAHELRTPLASIYGFAELLLDADGFGEVARREMLQIIFRQSKLISSLVNELLDLARIEARRGKDFVFENLDLGALVRETVEADSEACQWSGTLSIDLPGTPIWVRADANKLCQAVGNVLSNAYKYSPAGGDIQLSLRRAPGEIGVAVRDHGMGMTPEQISRVCERFYRADHASSIPGSGLGMSIVKEILTLHGGRLTVESESGVGTTVTLWLSDESTPPA